MKFYTPREVASATKARKLLEILGTPTPHDLKIAIATNSILNNPIKTTDVIRAEKVWWS